MTDDDTVYNEFEKFLDVFDEKMKCYQRWSEQQSNQVERNRREHVRTWNAAIEAAAKHFEQTWVGPDVIVEEIRKLKK